MTDAIAKEVEARSVDEMKPDFEVTAFHERNGLGLMFTFFIDEMAH